MINNCFFDSDVALQDEIVQLIVNRKLIPIIGSGFTCGCTAKNGNVPSGKDMEDYMKTIISIAYGKEKEDFEKDSFSQLCTKYNKRSTTEDKYEYFQNNFTAVQLSKIKQDFLSINWPYLYTLNIDDAIEGNCNKYQVILPRKEYYQKYIEEYDIVFKVHGDVHYYLKYIESEELIFNKKQYIESLKQNKKMLAKFEDDFSSNNLFYIGCSLSDEPDLLSVIQNVISTEKVHKSTYFLSNKKLDVEACDLLEDYGITTCIIVSDYDFFYKKIVELLLNHNIINEDIIGQFQEIKIEKADVSIDFMLKSDNLVSVPFRNFFQIPHFYISRSFISNIINDLECLSPIHLVYGHRISGKTYCLVDLYQRFKDKERYFFPTNTPITDKMMDLLLSNRNAVILIDTQCLSMKQMSKIVNYKKKLMEQKSFVIVAINSSDRYFVDLLVENPDYKTTLVPNYFDEKESDLINDIFESTNMPLFRSSEKQFNKVTNKYVNKKYTLLDNLYKIAVEFGNTNNKYLLPELSKIDDAKDFSILILLATQQAISSHDMFYYNITNACASFVNQYPTIVEWVYNDKFSLRTKSKEQLVANTRYYLLKILGDYSANEKKHKIIIDAYKYIFKQISDAEQNKFYTSKKMLDFIKFDVINDVFYRKNNSSVLLINSIYKAMEGEMNINPQFKHQRAKSILWLNANNLSEIKTAIGYINLAYYNTQVEYKKRLNQYLNISLGHISYTRAILYGRLCSLEEYADIDNIKSAIEYYENAFFNLVNKAELESLRSRKGDKRVYKDLERLLSTIKAKNIEQVVSDAKELYMRLKCFE